MKFLIDIKYVYCLTIVLTFLCYTDTTAQWRYEHNNVVDKDVFIEYDVTYDIEPTDDQKKTYRYLTKIIVLLNKDKLIERRYGKNSLYKVSVMLDYANNVFYNARYYKSKKYFIFKPFKEPVLHSELQEGEQHQVLGLTCDKYVSVVNGKLVNLYTTKFFGLRYAKKYQVDGLLLDYSGFDEDLGFYHVKATNITYLKLPPSIFTLEGAKIISAEDFKKIK